MNRIFKSLSSADKTLGVSPISQTVEKGVILVLHPLSYIWFPRLVFLLMLAIFILSGRTHVTSLKFEDYPFGADTPYYLKAYLAPSTLEPFISIHHSPTLALMKFCHWIADSLGEANTFLWPKIFFAFLGALNVTIACRLAYLIFPFGKNAVLFALFYGFSGSIWFFSSIPESYGLTSLFVTLYLYAFYRFYHPDRPWKFSHVSLMSILMAIGTLNEIVFSLILIIPVIHLARKIRSIRIAIPWISHLFIAVLMVILIEGRMTRQEAHTSVLTYYAKDISHERGKIYHRNKLDYSVSQEMKETVLNLSFFSVAFPSSSTHYAAPLFPEYEGYFEPSLSRYFHHLLPCLSLLLIFFASYKSVQAFKRTNPFFSLGLLFYVLIRMGLVFFYNPVEAFLYSEPMILPVVLLISYGLLTSPLSRDKYIFWLLICLVFLNNLHFFQKAFA